MKQWMLRYGKWLVAGLCVFAILLLAPQLVGLSVEDILNYTPSSPFLAALMLIGIYAAKSVLMILPSYGLYIVGGMLLPLGWAIVVAYIGLAVEMSLGFGFGRWLGQEAVHTLVQKNQKAKRFIGFLSRNSATVCFITRLLPMPYPVDLGSMVFGASGMPFWQHLVFSLLGFSAIMIPFTIAGGAISNPLSPQFLLPFAVSISLCILLFIVYRVWMKKHPPQGGEAAGPAPDENNES